MDRDVSEMTWPSSKRHVKSSRCTIRCAGECVELLLYMYTKSCLEYKPRSSASCHVHHATPSWIIVLWHAPLCVTPYVSFEADRAASFQTRSLTFFFFFLTSCAKDTVVNTYSGIKRRVTTQICAICGTAKLPPLGILKLITPKIKSKQTGSR